MVGTFIPPDNILFPADKSKKNLLKDKDSVPENALYLVG